MPDQDTDRWTRICRSQVWTEDIQPWLRALLEDSRKALQDCEMSEVSLQQGYCRAVEAILTMPDYMVAAARSREENEDAPKRMWFARRARD